MVELQFNCKIKGIQSDGGGEFKPLTKFLAPLGYSSVHKGNKCLSADGHIYISKDVQFHEVRFPYPELFPSSSTPVTSTTSASWFPSASPPIPTFNIPPLQHVSPTASSQPSSSIAESHIAENPPSSIPTQPISPIVSNAGSPSSPMHHSAFSDLAEANTISPSSNSPDTASSLNYVPIPPIHPLNIHPMLTRAKNGIIQPRVNPTLLLTHMEPTSIK
ncbi:hypothetical protein KIW84_040439 [Lathyrus oleraceus]|uniref:Uncharacterized protein n=1 Tax=Pisum sativum TaxID=3888 RepID=A0A9D4X595_PEA|nr:hypothetical protein KIW84_040439 [Pisum sativum]